MEVDLFGAGAEGQYLVHICHQFLRGAGTAGVVAGGLDAAGQGLGGVGIKAPDIISLPAVQGDGDSFQSGNGGFGVHANGSVAGFCFCVTHRVPPSEMLIWIFKLPMAVASMGSATTCFPV